MNNFECDLATDLLTIFIEGKCSVETNDFVKNHINECEKCSKIYEAMKQGKKLSRLRPAIKMALVILVYLVIAIVLLTVITFIFINGII